MRSFGIVVVSLLAVACGSSSESTAQDHGKVTLSGKVGGGSSTTQSFGGVSDTSGGLHVTAHEVFKKGAAEGRNVSVAVGADGSWSVAIARGSRWMVTVDSADGHSAMVMFGAEDVITVRADGGESRVDIGDLHVTGGTANANVTFDGFDLQATLAAADDAIVDAQGAILDAEQAAQEAVAEANAAVADAEKAAEDARKKAGGI
jgi:hypothetical protein